MFLQPVLLKARERSQSRVRRVGLTAALFVVQVDAAMGTEAAAVALTNGLQRQGQKHLFPQNVRQEEPISVKKANFGIVILQPVFFVLGVLGKRGIKKIEVAAYFFDDGLQTAGADQFDFGLEVAFDANLAFQKLGRRGYLERPKPFRIRSLRTARSLTSRNMISTPPARISKHSHY